jgi:hypothetical protein
MISIVPGDIASELVALSCLTPTRGATIMGRSFDGPACVHERFYMEEIRYRDDVENTSGTAIQELPNPRGTGMRKFSVKPPTAVQ